MKAEAVVKACAPNRYPVDLWAVWARPDHGATWALYGVFHAIAPAQRRARDILSTLQDMNDQAAETIIDASEPAAAINAALATYPQPDDPHARVIAA